MRLIQHIYFCFQQIHRINQQFEQELVEFIIIFIYFVKQFRIKQQTFY